MKKKLTNLLLIFISTGLTLLLAEGVVRVFWPQNLIYHNDAVWRPDAKFGWRHHENANTKINFGQAEVTFRTNEEGFRINARKDENQRASKQSILVLGDSFLEAVQMESRNTVPQVLQTELNKQSKIDSHFYNAGVSGWDPNHYFLETQRVLAKGEPEIDRVLVFLYLANDIVREEVAFFQKKDKHNTRSFRMPRSFSKREFARGVLYPMNDFLDKKSHLYALIKTKNNKLLTKIGLSSNYFPVVFRKRFQDHSSWATTIQICKKIEQAFAKNDVPVSFVLIPTTYQVNPEVQLDYLNAFDVNADSVDMEQPNRILAQLFAKDSLTLFDPLSFFKEKTSNGIALYGSIDAHFNEEGHNAMAEYLMPMLSQALQPVELIEN